MQAMTPGPGAYAGNALSQTFGAKSYSIGLKLGSTLNVSEAAKIPGPGAYNVVRQFPTLATASPKFSFPKGGYKYQNSSSVSRSTRLPDPASYTPKL